MTALPADLEQVLEQVAGVDEGTAGVIAALHRRGGLPPAAFFTAYESLQARRRRGPLRNEMGYFVASLKTMQAEGRHA